MARAHSPKARFYTIRWGGPSQEDPLGLVLVKDDTRGFNEHRFYECKPIDDWPQGIVFFMNGEIEEDFLAVGLHWTVVSDRVRRTLEGCRVTGVEFLPVRVVQQNKGKEIGPYWAMNVVRDPIDALDWERTRWMPDRDPNDKYPTLDIIREALRLDAVRGVDVFRIVIKGRIDTGFYISQRVEDCLETAGATLGLGLITIPAF